VGQAPCAHLGELFALAEAGQEYLGPLFLGEAGHGEGGRPLEAASHLRLLDVQTTLEFRPTLQRQRDDAADKGQVGRQKVFDGLLERLDEEAS
jgi:hypothetical protein